MAVTYAWRLDANKFAYIVSPYNGNQNGYLTTAALTGSLLQNVATTAEERFGINAYKGLQKYMEAFAEMEGKIKDKWGELEYADLLSADMYYDVDAQNCADLRGVGIKGTMYLGSLPNLEGEGINLNNVSFYASGATTANGDKILPGLPGYIDIYGIYLTDQIEDEKDVEDAAKSAPEYMFVVRNGKDGVDGTVNGEGGELIDNLRNEFLGLIKGLQDEINNLKLDVSNLNDRVTILEDYIEESYPDAEWKTDVDRDIMTISGAVKSINDKIDNLQPGTGGGSGGSTGGGSISVESIEGINEGGYYILASEQNGGTIGKVFALDYAVANEAGIVIGSSDAAQVQISSGGTLQSTDKIYAKNGFYQTTTNIEKLPEV